MTPDAETPDLAPRDEAARPATSPMTLVTVISERIIRDRVLAGIRKAGARGFTLTDVTGEGSRLIHAHEWEGPSVKIETLVPPAVADRILSMVADRYFEHHAVIVYTSEVQVVRARRFRPDDVPNDGPDQG